jgi:hypothetical protein
MPPAAVPPGPPIHSLFTYTHIRGVSWEGEWLRPWTWRLVGVTALVSRGGLLLLMYLPVGVALLLLRLQLVLCIGT